MRNLKKLLLKLKLFWFKIRIASLDADLKISLEAQRITETKLRKLLGEDYIKDEEII